MATAAQPKRRRPKTAAAEPTPDLIPPGATSTTTPGGLGHFYGAAEDAIAETVSREMGPVDMDGVIRKLPLRLLARHPENRVPSEERIASVAASLAEVGQLEPLLVRRCGEVYQILSGETRFLAAQRLDWPHVQARVVACDDGQALHLVAIANGERADLNPIEQAKLITRLCAPPTDGGSGLTREAAARAVGLQTGSAASNLVRLLELPEPWLSRVAAGELPQTFARELLPLAKAPMLLDLLEEDWEDRANGHPCNAFQSRIDLAHAVDGTRHEHTRPLGKERRYYHVGHGPGMYGEFPCLFQLTDEVREQLGIVTITIDGQAREVATNVALYDELQRAAVMAKAAKKATKGAAAAEEADEKTPAKSAGLTPDEMKQKAAEAKRKLAERIAKWRHAFLRAAVADAVLCIGEMDRWKIAALALWLLAEVRVGYAAGSMAQRLVDWMRLVRTESGRRQEIAVRGDRYDPARTLKYLIANLDPDDDPVSDVEDLQRRLVADLLHPPGANEAAGLPYLADEAVRAIAGWLGVTLAEEWQRGMIRGSEGRAYVERFLQLHDRAQLEALCVREWKRPELARDATTKKDLVAALLAAHGAKPFPLPRVLGERRKR